VDESDSENILSLSQPNALNSMSTTGLKKIALYREKKKLTPSPLCQDISGYYEHSYSYLPHQHCKWF
jgi:hypothetical protein